jgi:hypothetical protein
MRLLSPSAIEAIKSALIVWDFDAGTVRGAEALSLRPFIPDIVAFMTHYILELY